MSDDPIVEEFRSAGNEYAASFDHDLDVMFEDLRRRQKERGALIVSFVDKEGSGRDPEVPARKAVAGT